MQSGVGTDQAIIKVFVFTRYPQIELHLVLIADGCGYRLSAEQNGPKTSLKMPDFAVHISYHVNKLSDIIHNRIKALFKCVSNHIVFVTNCCVSALESGLSSVA